ncbi:MAG: branched-chain amino acid transport system ATP-binding protein livF [Frankiaceae bacterium]|nr:branched-chain amino acid transport system ATP-binding protein livF [Frankiaceae bacterium]
MTAVTQADALATARATVGVGDGSARGSLRGELRRHAASWYTLTVLGVLAVVDQFQGTAFVILSPEIGRALGVGKTELAGVFAIKTLAVTLCTLPIAALVQKGRRRAALAIVTAFTWSVLTIFTGFVAALPWLLLVLVADGVSTASVTTVHQPLLLDTYPPSTRVRVLSAYRTWEVGGAILTPLLVAVLATTYRLTWRGTFVALGLASLMACLVSLRLRDPGFGVRDEAAVRAALGNPDAVPETESEGLGADLGFFEIARRLLLIPTIRRVLGANALLGLAQIPLSTYLVFFLADRWRLGVGERAVFFGFVQVVSVGALVAFGRYGERLFREDPARLVLANAVAFSVATLCVCAGFLVPVFAVVAVLFAAAGALFATLGPALATALHSTIPARFRPHAAALAGVSYAAIGGTGGLVLLGGVDRRYGTVGIVVVIALSGAVVTAVIRGAAKTINADLDTMLAQIVEEEESRRLVASGRTPPLLACRGLDFSYGQVQVLFGVDFTVDDGEMVALLGTNGAGKSTLLRVVSGLGLPSAGSVRLRGVDMTYVDPERRVRMGVVQVPGGRAVFGPLTVAENLKLFGGAAGRNARSVDAGIEAAFETFPRLYERRGQPASTLSGGEQQMLGLSQALILSPRLLLIDELSLGLAPKVVGELIAMVQRINAAGTAVVLVEQSVNIALSVVEHAYFMERGEMQFDGPARKLLARKDLLRSVFLEGASKAGVKK